MAGGAPEKGVCSTIKECPQHSMEDLQPLEREGQGRGTAVLLGVSVTSKGLW